VLKWLGTIPAVAVCTLCKREFREIRGQTGRSRISVWPASALVPCGAWVGFAA